MRILLFIVTHSTLLFSCAKPYKYFGRSYVPTPVVKLYFREPDIVEPYEVMGKPELKQLLHSPLAAHRVRIENLKIKKLL